jgi:hypothetical protein
MKGLVYCRKRDGAGLFLYSQTLRAKMTIRETVDLFSSIIDYMFY